MKNDRKGPGDYIHRVSEDTKRYAQEILKENEKLRLQTLKLTNELDRRSREFEQASEMMNQTSNFRMMVNLLEEQVEVLKRRNLEISKEALSQKNEADRLKEQISRIEAENREFSEQYAFVERNSNNLMNLYVTSYRMHETLDRKEVLDAISETVINLIGSEDFALFELDNGGDTLSLVSSFGIDEEHFQKIQLGQGPIGETTEMGVTFVANQGEGKNGLPDDKSLLALVPLKLDDRVIGAIAIFSLLPQKQELEDVDYELFDLLATHAATALYCTRLHSGIKGEGAAEV